MKNLELKVALEDFDTIFKSLASLGVKESDIKYQIDTYFLVGKKRLKLRCMDGESNLIFYSRPDIQGSRISRYYVFALTNRQKAVIEKFFSTFFTAKAIVIKKRILYKYKHTRIHLDEVKSLGSFLELETVFDRKEPQYDFYHEHNTIIDTLKLLQYKKIKSSYSDLILEKTGRRTL